MLDPKLIVAKENVSRYIKSYGMFEATNNQLSYVIKPINNDGDNIWPDLSHANYGIRQFIEDCTALGTTIGNRTGNVNYARKIMLEHNDLRILAEAGVKFGVNHEEISAALGVKSSAGRQH